MGRRPFTQKKKNEVKNQEAIDLFNRFNRLAPSTRAKYFSTINQFMEFLLAHKKSLWDADYMDIKKFLNSYRVKGTRSVLSTFYRVLIDSGDYKRENPVVQLAKYEREHGQYNEEEYLPPEEAENVIKELENEESSPITPKLRKEKKRITIGKQLMTRSDLEQLLQKATHIRDKAILEFLYVTGARIQEIINLMMPDVDLEARQVTIKYRGSYRVLILPKRTVAFLRIYDRWRKRKLSPSPYYFITKDNSKKQMSDTSISNWLRRIQRDKPEKERWNASDFRKRAILHHYYITRDLTAVARFAGYTRPESALNVISNILKEQGVDSIDMLSGLPEDDKYTTQKQKIATVSGNEGLTITVQLRPEDMEYIRSTGLTPTQAIRTILSFQSIYGGEKLSSTPKKEIKEESSKSTTTPKKVSSTPSGPIGTPKIGAPNPNAGPKILKGGPNLSAKPAGGPNLSAKPAGGPNLSAKPAGGPNLSAKPAGGPNLSAKPAGGASFASSIASAAGNLKKAPGGAAPKAAAEKPAAPMSQMSELKAILAKRRQRSSENEQKKDDQPSVTPLGGKIGDAPPKRPALKSIKEKKKDEDEDDEEIPELPSFDF